MVDPRARQTRRAAGILRLLGHGVGGRPGERLAARLGFAAKRGTTLRHLIRHQRLPDHSAPRVIGIDERASRKGLRFGTIAVDLERREVIDVLPDRSAVSTAAWLAERPSIELVARDRDGPYADASRQGAAQARQIADRFHPVQNLRAAIERQLSGFLLAAGGLRRDMASKVRDEADAIFDNRDLAPRSSDGRRDLADRRSGAVHPTRGHTDAASGGDGRCP